MKKILFVKLLLTGLIFRLYLFALDFLWQDICIDQGAVFDTAKSICIANGSPVQFIRRDSLAEIIILVFFSILLFFLNYFLDKKIKE